MPTSEQIEKARKAAPPFWRDTADCEKHIAKMLSAAEGVKPRVKPLDLSNLLKHAFFSGYAAAIGKDEPTGERTQKWVEYDPEGLAPYDRISALVLLAALEPTNG